jgi:hypothetical protein
MAFNTEASHLENLCVYGLACLTICTTIALWTDSPYRFHILAFWWLVIAAGGVLFDPHRHSPWGLALRICGWPLLLSFNAYSSWTVGRAVAAIRSGEWQYESDQVESWTQLLGTAERQSSVIEFDAGSFWTGYFTYRLVDRRLFWVVARFRRHKPLGWMELRAYPPESVSFPRAADGGTLVKIGGKKLAASDLQGPLPVFS